MKKKAEYENAEVDIMLFYEADIITTSGEPETPGQPPDTDWSENTDNNGWT